MHCEELSLSSRSSPVLIYSFANLCEFSDFSFNYSYITHHVTITNITRFWTDGGEFK